QHVADHRFKTASRLLDRQSGRRHHHHHRAADHLQLHRPGHADAGRGERAAPVRAQRHGDRRGAGLRRQRAGAGAGKDRPALERKAGRNRRRQRAGVQPGRHGDGGQRGPPSRRGQRAGAKERALGAFRHPRLQGVHRQFARQQVTRAVAVAERRRWRIEAADLAHQEWQVVAAAAGFFRFAHQRAQAVADQASRVLAHVARQQHR
ncbi:conserved hypothetical protein, partial [Ricinus communis]